MVAGLGRAVVYNPQLDGLRAIAVVAVVLFHSGRTLPGGFIGVDLFFVLSAFLITGVLSREPELGRFYWRRFWRLMPALLLFLAVYLLVAPFVWPLHPHARDALVTGLYLSDYGFALAQVPLYLQHTWSLAVEEHFYLLWPFAVPLLLRSRNPALWLVAAFVAGALWRALEPEHLQYYYRFDMRATGLLLGALLFFMVPKLKLSPIYAYAGLALFAAVAVFGQFDNANAFIPLAEIGAAMIIACAAAGKLGALGALLSGGAIVALGRWSYGIYLWHYPIAVAVRDELPPIQAAVVVLTLSIGFAALSYYTVEAWGRGLRDRLEHRRSMPFECPHDLSSARSGEG